MLNIELGNLAGIREVVRHVMRQDEPNASADMILIKYYFRSKTFRHPPGETFSRSRRLVVSGIKRAPMVVPSAKTRILSCLRGFEGAAGQRQAGLLLRIVRVSEHNTNRGDSRWSQRRAKNHRERRSLTTTF